MKKTARLRLPPLIPAPRSARRLQGDFRLRDGLSIALGAGADDADFDSARALQDGVRTATGINLDIEGHARTSDLDRVIVLARRRRQGEPSNQRAGDAYTVSVRPRRIELEGAGSAGLRYAVETLIQLTRRSGRVPACRIEDAPDFELRGIMLDVSRGKVPTPATLRLLVDLCVKLKLNALMLYVEHTFRFRRHPEIGAQDSPLDAETLRELDRYAAARHVELIPSLQSLGHMEHVLKLPAYRHLAETKRGWTISPQEPGTLELLRDLYDEYLPNFRSGLFNSNCDEPWDLEQGKSAERASELGPGGVYLEHVGKLRDLAAKHGKRTLIWADVVHAHPERIPEIDRNLLLLDWWYEASFDFDRVKRFKDAGLEFVVCPGTSSWNSLFPRIENSRLNIARWADAGRRHGARGLITTDWGDFGHYNLQGNSWFGYAWTAQQAWSGECPESEFDGAFASVLFGDETATIGRIYRTLGAIHDPGFRIFNGSALMYLFFDDMERSYFMSAATPGALRRCERQLRQVLERISQARGRFARDVTTCDELRYAAEASLFAVRKATAGLEYNAWRRRPERWKAPERKRLARSLHALAREQARLGRVLRKLWLARSAISNLDMTAGRIARSAASLRAAAKKLERNKPSEAPPAHAGFTGRDVMRALRESLG